MGSGGGYDDAAERMPQELFHAFGFFKKAAARANYELLPERMNEEKCAAVFASADEIIRCRVTDESPFALWQTGLGRLTDGKVNELLAARGSEMADEEGLLRPEDVGMSQTAEGAFHACVCIAAAFAVAQGVLPAARSLSERLEELEESCAALRAEELLLLPDFAEKTAPEGFEDAVAEQLARLTGQPFAPGTGSAVCRLAQAHRPMRALAEALERSCTGEWRELAAMTAARLTGVDAELSAAAERDAADHDILLPLCAHDFLTSAGLLGDLLATLAGDGAAN